LESKPSDLERRWSPNLQIWKDVGVQTFRFGRALESKPSDLEGRWSPNLQIWKDVGVQKGHPSKVVDRGEVHGTKLLSRNESQMWVSGKQRSSIPETIVHYFYRDMKGAPKSNKRS